MRNGKQDRFTQCWKWFLILAVFVRVCTSRFGLCQHQARLRKLSKIHEIVYFTFDSKQIQYTSLIYCIDLLYFHLTRLTYSSIYFFWIRLNYKYLNHQLCCSHFRQINQETTAIYISCECVYIYSTTTSIFNTIIVL